LAPDAAWATVPYGVQFAAVLACTYPVSALMRKLGRRPVFLGSAVLLMLAGCAGMLALQEQSFAGLVLAHALVGAYVACANFFRFAAVDGLQEPARAQALSWVVAGGVLAALAGPLMANTLRQVPGFTEFAWVYGGLMGLGLAQLALMTVWKPAGRAPESVAMVQKSPAAAGPPSTKSNYTRKEGPRLALAIATAAGGYLVMNLLMVQTSLVLQDLCSFEMSARAIQMHVLAMFAPSYVTGWLIGRWGLRVVISAGLLLLVLAAALGVTLSPSYEAAIAGLFLLGLGWNLSYVGGSALLAQAAPERERHRWQGIHETVTAAAATAGAFLPAPLLAHAGWSGTNGLALGLCIAGLLACQRILLPSGRYRGQHA
jgi:MFS family permease